jgi:aspartate/methionine/tyrosine aminotransferase
VDRNTKLILVNSPHNPTGATISDAELDSLHEFTASREIQLVSNEIFHPIYHGQATRSASRLPHATVIHDFSKAFPLSGVRTGWMIEHNPKRRERYWNARTYLSVSNNTAGEMSTAIPSLGKRRKQQLRIFGSLPPSCPSIARRLAGFLLVAE